MRTRDIKINRLVQFNISYKKLNTINPTFQDEVFKIIETVNLSTGVLVHVRSVNFPKVALWVSSTHIEVAQKPHSAQKSIQHDVVQHYTPQPIPSEEEIASEITEIKTGDIVVFNPDFNRELNYRFKIIDNYEHIKNNKHVVVGCAKTHPDSWVYRNEPAIKINCWWLPASWFEHATRSKKTVEGE